MQNMLSFQAFILEIDVKISERVLLHLERDAASK